MASVARLHRVASVARSQGYRGGHTRGLASTPDRLLNSPISVLSSSNRPVSKDGFSETWAYAGTSCVFDTSVALRTGNRGYPVLVSGEKPLDEWNSKTFLDAAIPSRTVHSHIDARMADRLRSGRDCTRGRLGSSACRANRRRCLLATPGYYCRA